MGVPSSLVYWLHFEVHDHQVDGKVSAGYSNKRKFTGRLNYESQEEANQALNKIVSDFEESAKKNAKQ